ncbi:precorrin-3B C(17)-methyltransferase [Protofrankia symbiont of Coriaria ruscifolia]|uniref:precorrin-3B C(17)-methyltransferase n=1 Tax=Protofrankia symbiont of Coriaria ruscifolia TaxID=1306542 RepID=UPI001F5E74FC|nr:precorrin-3B C(17)-methyltransferase [Protofrankia symbiont of Coriaria ruscifolia]
MTDGRRPPDNGLRSANGPSARGWQGGGDPDGGVLSGPATTRPGRTLGEASRTAVVQQPPEAPGRSGIGLVAVTAAGRAAARELEQAWPDARLYDGTAREALTAAVAERAGVVCFLATGATVRLLADNLLTGKDSDPGVVCVDEARRWAVALVGGHAGGANDLAGRVAAALGATAIVTTASDACATPALDSFGADIGLRVEPGSQLAAVGTAILSGEPVTLHADAVWPLPALPETVRFANPADPADLGETDETDETDGADAARPVPQIRPATSAVPTAPAPPIRPTMPTIVITDRIVTPPAPAVVYRPPSLVVGVGASRGVPEREVVDLVESVLADAGLSPLAVRHLATVEAKQDETGIVAAARTFGWPLVVHPAAALAAVDVPHPSEVVRAAVGTPSVAEAASLLAAGGTMLAGGAELVVPKRVSAHATVAVARHRPRGRLAIVGLGPGDRDLLTPRAARELARASVIVGLDQYVDSVRDLIRPGARVLASGLGSEEARAGAAVEAARAGHAVALIGSGDAGVYAMGSPALDQADDSFDVVGVPGVTAALSAAALLGAPLGHDHMTISLSDLHTPWEVIERRVRAAAQADVVVAFYNPRSRTRTWQLPRALALLAEHRPPSTPVGIVTDAFRPAQQVTVTTIGELAAAPAPHLDLVGMTTTVVVGSTHTRVVAGHVVTPRGYRWS